MPKKLTPSQQKRVKDFLKARGHRPDKLDRLNWSDDEAMKDSLLALHGVSKQSYEAVR